MTNQVPSSEFRVPSAGLRAEVGQSIVSSARRNMRAHALAWREASQWHDRVAAVMKLRRAILWREVSQTIERQTVALPMAA